MAKTELEYNLMKIKEKFARGKLFVQVGNFDTGEFGIIPCSHLNRVIVGDIRDTLFPYYALGIIFLGENYKFKMHTYSSVEDVAKSWRIIE